MVRQYIQRVILVSLALGLAACGGGGDDVVINDVVMMTWWCVELDWRGEQLIPFM